MSTLIIIIIIFFSFLINLSYSIDLCNSLNSAQSQVSVSIYQSNGLCQNHCSDLNYAYAILLNKNCWCSNLTPDPDDDVSTSECNDSCPGYPDDSCGSVSDSYYAYIQI
ncbi:uncharacterized protein ASCRUDRAFT_35093, partial [Ascoidea rubescens DSM 1968]